MDYFILCHYQSIGFQQYCLVNASSTAQLIRIKAINNSSLTSPYSPSVINTINGSSSSSSSSSSSNSIDVGGGNSNEPSSGGKEMM